MMTILSTVLTLAVFVYVNWNHADRIRYVLKNNKKTEQIYP